MSDDKQRTRNIPDRNAQGAGLRRKIRSPFQPLRNRNFLLFTLGNVSSLIGTWMQRIAVGWLAWDMTGSATWLGLLAFADLFPTVVFGPAAGAAADRWSRLQITRITQLLGATQALVLFGLVLADQLTIVILLLITLFHGFIAALNQPARLALVHSLVPRDELHAAVAINSVSFNIARLTGPAIAGGLIAIDLMPLVFGINSLSFISFLVVLMLINVEGGNLVKRHAATFLADMADGVVYAARHQGIRAVMLLMVAAGMGCRPVVELMPGFADGVFNAGPTGLAVLSSSIAAGAICGGIWMGSRAGNLGLTWYVMAGSLGLLVSILLFTVVDQLWEAAITLVIAGFFMTWMSVASQTAVQFAVDNAMRGRVLSLHGLIFRGSPAVGALGMGIAADVVGLRWPLAVGCLALLGVWLIILRGYTNIFRSLEVCNRKV